MRISAFFVPFFALLAGVGGFYLRLSELWNVFDARSGLPERGAATTIWLLALAAVYLLAIFIFALFASMKHKAPQGFENAFGTDPIAYPVLFILIGIAWLTGTMMYFFELNSSGTLEMIDIYFIALSALSAISTAVFAIEMYQDSRRKSPFALSIVPTVFMCFWLILLYRQNASNPVLLSYGYECLAIVFAALSFYFTSGFLYGKPAPGKSIFAYYAAIFFCLVTMADDHPVSIRVIYAAIIAASTIHSSMLIRNLESKQSDETAKE